MALPSVLWLLLHGDLLRAIMGITGVLYILLALVTAYRYNDALIRSLRLAHEKSELARSCIAAKQQVEQSHQQLADEGRHKVCPPIRKRLEVLRRNGTPKTTTCRRAAKRNKTAFKTYLAGSADSGHMDCRTFNFASNSATFALKSFNCADSLIISNT